MKRIQNGAYKPKTKINTANAEQRAFTASETVKTDTGNEPERKKRGDMQSMYWVDD